MPSVLLHPNANTPLSQGLTRNGQLGEMEAVRYVEAVEAAVAVALEPARLRSAPLALQASIARSDRESVENFGELLLFSIALNLVLHVDGSLVHRPSPRLLSEVYLYKDALILVTESRTAMTPKGERPMGKYLTGAIFKGGQETRTLTRVIKLSQVSSVQVPGKYTRPSCLQRGQEPRWQM